MNNQIAKKHSKTIVRVVHYCKICVKDFHSFYSLGALKQKKWGAQRGSRVQNVDVTQLMGDVDDKSLKEELERCKHFLIDSEMEKGRHNVFNFVTDTLE